MAIDALNLAGVAIVALALLFVRSWLSRGRVEQIQRDCLSLLRGLHL